MIRLLAVAALAVELVQPTPLRVRYENVLHAVSDAERTRALGELSQVAPQSLDDVRRLFDLFMRMPDPGVRSAVMASIERLTPASARQLEAGFAEYVKVSEPEARVFGMRGLARLKSPVGSAYIRDLAKGKFSKPTPEELELPSERDAWHVKFEALATLAAVEGPKAKSLVASHVERVPRVARIYAAHYWSDALAKLTQWKPDQRAEALRASVPFEDLKKTRAQMLAVVGNPKAPRDLRHELALKVGIVSEPAEVKQLLDEHAAAKDPDTKLFLLAALYATRDPQTVPLLREQALKNPDARTRLGTLVQLTDMLPPAESKRLLEEAAKTDPDPENKEEIVRLLKAR